MRRYRRFPEPDQQVTAIMDRVAAGPCIGTEGNGAITGYPERDVLLSLEGDAVGVDYAFAKDYG